jgi:hypothetical protein
VGESV